MLPFILCTALAAIATQAEAVSKVAPKLELSGKYQVIGRKVKVVAVLANPVAEGAPESIESHSKMGEKPLNNQALAGVASESGAAGGQKRSAEWTVPPLPPGEAELFWKSGDQVVGPATAVLLKTIEGTDWDKADDATLSNAAALIDTDYGQMLLEFYPAKAPNTVRNFLKLAGKGFYDGVTFHRIIKDFMIQGGDPTGTGAGDPGYKIKAEFSDVAHKKGIISMARSAQDPDSAGSQFFIVQAPQYPSLDNKYTAFGKLLDGYDTLDKLASVTVERSARGEPSKPKNKIYMRKVTVVEKPAAMPAK